MSESRGFLMVAYRDPARRAALRCADSVRTHMPRAAISVIADKPLGKSGVLRHIYAPDLDPGARIAKLNADLLSPYKLTAYLDADVKVQGDLSAGFEMLADGWEMAMAPSVLQNEHVFGHADDEDREYTLAALGGRPLAYQAGVIFWRACAAVHRLFAVWRAEWQRFQRFDQAALMRALDQVPVRIWLLATTYNSPDRDGLVWHQFGRARR